MLIPMPILGESKLHLFLSSNSLVEALPIYINGEKAFELKGDLISETDLGENGVFRKYKKSYCPVIFSNEGKFTIGYNMVWHDVPYHEDIIISVEDGDEVYLKLYMPSLIEALSTNRVCYQFKIIKDKDGQKELKKVNKGKYTINPSYVYKK